MKTVGITALVPPELVYSCNKRPIDINNYVPSSNIIPSEKLCAWCAIWREMILNKTITIDELVVVAGGDCHNALVEGQKVSENGIKTHYFFYPFDGDCNYFESQLNELNDFLGGIKDNSCFEITKKIKKEGLELDKKRVDAKIHPQEAFDVFISFSDLGGNPTTFNDKLVSLKEKEIDTNLKIALIGVPPIYKDFHTIALSFGLNIVFDELPYEFMRYYGSNISELAKSYSNYTFARDVSTRIKSITKEIEKRKIDGVIHYTQYACHHFLEDSMLREHIDYPFITIQGDIPHKTPEQAKLRLEAFSEMLNRR